MNRTHQNKQKNNSIAVANQLSSKHTQSAQLVNNRADAALQRRISNISNSNSQSIQMENGLEEEELLQGKFNTAQLEELEEEELLQGKFNTAQLEELDEEELLQGKFNTAQLEELDEEELLQGKFASGPVQKKENSPGATNNTGLPDGLKSGIENLSGNAMDNVKVHYNSPKPAQLNALAYAQGTDIHLGAGQEKHLPHEAWHVVQQSQGRVSPTTQMNGTNINDDVSLEKEADVMGAKAQASGSNNLAQKKKD